MCRSIDWRKPHFNEIASLSRRLACASVFAGRKQEEAMFGGEKSEKIAQKPITVCMQMVVVLVTREYRSPLDRR